MARTLGRFIILFFLSSSRFYQQNRESRIRSSHKEVCLFTVKTHVK